MKNILQDFIKYCEFEQNCSPVLKKVIFSNGSEHLRYQCMSCGKVHGNPVSKENKDISQIPYVDNEKLDNYNNIYKTSSDNRVTSHALFVKAQKECKLNRIIFFEQTFKVKYESFEQAYDLYIKSPLWVSKRNKILERDGYKCRICNKSGLIDVHHMNYSNLCNESEHELLSLCRECHSTIHMHIQQ